MTTTEQIQQARKVLIDNGYIDAFWRDVDVEDTAEEMGYRLTPEQLNELTGIIGQRHDCNEGINWVVIQTQIDIYAENNKIKR